MTTAEDSNGEPRWRVCTGHAPSVLAQLPADTARMGYVNVRPPERYAHNVQSWTRHLAPVLSQLMRVVSPDGGIFLAPEGRDAHYAKVAADHVLGRERFRNEIVLVHALETTGETRARWEPGHEVVFWYSLKPAGYCYNYEDIDRVPYLAPALVGPEKAARGKVPTDVWWPSDEHAGDADRWRRQVLQRLVRTHSDPGDTVLDCFAGTDTLAGVALDAGRRCVIVPAGLDQGGRIALALAAAGLGNSGS